MCVFWCGEELVLHVKKTSSWVRCLFEKTLLQLHAVTCIALGKNMLYCQHVAFICLGTLHFLLVLVGL